MFTHTGNQLAAVTTTVDTDPARVGEGYVWTTDPTTGEAHGQIALTTSDNTDTPANPAAGRSQARVDATFYALVCDLAGAPQELINTTTGVVEGHTTQTLYGKRTWAGRCTSPLLFAGQYEDVESGWAYNRFRYYSPTLGAYNAQDPLGLAPRLASAQGYVDHAAYWVDVLGLIAHSKRKDIRSQVLSEIAEINKAGSAASSAVKNGVMDPSQLRKGHPDAIQYIDSTRQPQPIDMIQRRAGKGLSEALTHTRSLPPPKAAKLPTPTAFRLPLSALREANSSHFSQQITLNVGIRFKSILS